MCQKNYDLIDELATKNKAIEDIEATSSLTSSQSSLKEELSQCKMLACDECNLSFSMEAELKHHQTTSNGTIQREIADMIEKLNVLEKEVSDQKVNLMSSTFQLKNQEVEEGKFCFDRRYCKKYCKINHPKHNFTKSRSEEIFSKLGKISTSPNPSTQTEVLGTQTEVLGFRAVRKQYTCSQCEEVFSKQGLLKKHKKIKHKLKETKMGK